MLTKQFRLLTGGDATGAAISQVLTQLGSQTKSAASGADGVVSDKLQQLAELLPDPTRDRA